MGGSDGPVIHSNFDDRYQHLRLAALVLHLQEEDIAEGVEDAGRQRCKIVVVEVPSGKKHQGHERRRKEAQ